MSINWKVRLKNPSFWVGIVGAVGVCAISIAAVCGVDISSQVDGIVANVTTVVTALFSAGALVGVVTDPTTSGVTDSEQALTYSVPKPKTAAEALEEGVAEIVSEAAAQEAEDGEGSDV
jgi:phi LC3 family holin